MLQWGGANCSISRTQTQTVIATSRLNQGHLNRGQFNTRGAAGACGMLRAVHKLCQRPKGGWGFAKC